MIKRGSYGQYRSRLLLIIRLFISFVKMGLKLSKKYNKLFGIYPLLTLQKVP